MINFRKVELENQKAYKPYMAQQQCRSCECTFANLYLWSRFYAVTATVENGMLLTKSEEGDYLSYGFPMGKPKYLKEAVDALYEYSKEKKRKFQMHNVTPEQFALLEEIYPGRFQIEYPRIVRPIVCPSITNRCRYSEYIMLFFSKKQWSIL